MYPVVYFELLLCIKCDYRNGYLDTFAHTFEAEDNFASDMLEGILKRKDI